MHTAKHDKNITWLDIDECKRTNVMISGTNSSGKSLTAMAISDKLMLNGFQIYVIDSTGVWRKKSSIPSYWQVSETTMKYVLPRSSIIYDVSRLTASYQREFLESILNEVWLRSLDENRQQWLMIVIEEAHLIMRHIRGRASENLLRICSVGRNVNIRTLAISPSFVGLDAEFRRLAQQRYHFRLPNESNTKRRFCSIYSKDWYRVAKHLDTGFCIYYLNERMQVVKIPKFVSNVRPMPYYLPKPQVTEPKKRKLIDRIKIALSGHEEPEDLDEDDTGVTFEDEDLIDEDLFEEDEL